jgi:hypothetical protein
MFLIGLGALLVLGGVLYKTQCHLAGDRLAARIPPGGRFAVLWSRHGAAWDSWGLGTNSPHSPYGIGAILLVSGRSCRKGHHAPPVHMIPRRAGSPPYIGCIRTRSAELRTSHPERAGREARPTMRRVSRTR